MQPWSIRLLLCCAAVSFSQPAAAQRSNYENVLFGERATGMGGAFIGLADDPSAVFYNPAGIAQLEHEALSLSAQAYAAWDIDVEDALQLSGATGELEVTGFGTFPTSSAYVVPLSETGDVRHALALSVLAPYIQSYELRQSIIADDGSGDLTFEAGVSEFVLAAGPTYAVRIGPVSFGASVYLQYSSLLFDGLLAGTANPAGELERRHETRRSSGKEIALTGIVGALVELGPRWALGLRVRLPNLALWSNGSHTLTRSFSRQTLGMPPSELRQDTFADVEGDLNYPHPLGFAIGLGYEAPQTLRFAADLRMYLPLSSYDLMEGELQTGSDPASPSTWDPTIRVSDSELVINGSIGGEFAFGDTYSFLLGLHTDMAAQRPSTDLEVHAASTMTHVGISLGARRRSPIGSFTISTVIRYGSGEINALVVDDGIARGEPIFVEQLTGIIALSWSRELESEWVQQIQGD